MRVSWLNLHVWIPQRDVRKLIYAQLTRLDRKMVELAHLSNRPIRDKWTIPKECIKDGHFELFKWTLKCGYMFGDLGMKKAIKYERVDVIEYMVGGIVPSPLFCTFAAGFGNLSIFRLLENLGYPVNTIDVVKAAASGGHLHILENVIGVVEMDTWDFHYICHVVERHGHTHVLNWLQRGDRIFVN